MTAARRPEVVVGGRAATASSPAGRRDRYVGDSARRAVRRSARLTREPRVRAAAAGATAATVWAALEPLDQRLLGCDYSDVAVLGKAVTRRHWLRVGLSAARGATAPPSGSPSTSSGAGPRSPPRRLALAAALAEHVALYPLCFFVDRYHPARGEPGIPPLLRNPRAFAQATLRHAVFGLVLGRLAGGRR